MKVDVFKVQHGPIEMKVGMFLELKDVERIRSFENVSTPEALPPPSDFLRSEAMWSTLVAWHNSASGDH